MTLEWIDDRWHLDGHGIHAGTTVELCGADGQWFPVRLESANKGQTLIAFTRIHGLDFTKRIDTEYDQLRWPR